MLASILLNLPVPLVEDEGGSTQTDDSFKRLLLREDDELLEMISLIMMSGMMK